MQLRSKPFMSCLCIYRVELTSVSVHTCIHCTGYEPRITVFVVCSVLRLINDPFNVRSILHVRPRNDPFYVSYRFCSSLSNRFTKNKMQTLAQCNGCSMKMKRKLFIDCYCMSASDSEKRHTLVTRKPVCALFLLSLGNCTNLNMHGLSEPVVKWLEAVAGVCHLLTKISV